jgi:hypothetical protein
MHKVSIFPSFASSQFFILVWYIFLLVLGFKLRTLHLQVLYHLSHTSSPFLL